VIVEVTPLFFISSGTHRTGSCQVRLATDLEHSRVSNWAVIKLGKYTLAWIEVNVISKHEMYMSYVP
jgi:hypothetical protein